jgi:hypothetical protein
MTRLMPQPVQGRTQRDCLNEVRANLWGAGLRITPWPSQLPAEC